MNMVIPDEGKLVILNEVFKASTTREGFVLDLFSNNETVDDDSTFSDFVVANFTGYSQVSIARSDWGTPAIDSHEGVITTTSAPVFTCSGGSPQTVYGWILRGASSGLIYAGQNFDTPRVMSNGATETLDPFAIRDKTFT